MRTSDDGGIVTSFVLLLLVAMMAVLGVVVDGGRALSAHEQAVTEADQAARAGAGALSVSALHGGSVRIDDEAAVRAAQEFMAASGHPGQATSAGGVVTVHVSFRVSTDLLGLVHVDSIEVHASASAVDVRGVVQEMP